MSYLAARRQEEKERRRSDIHDAAEAVAGRAGVDGHAMEEVAREARLSRALLYVYFKDKADLTAAVCERALAELHQRFVAATHTVPSGADKVLAIGRAYVAFARELPVKFEFLARLEARCIVESLLRQTRQIGFDPAKPPVWARSIFVRRLERIPLPVVA